MNYCEENLSQCHFVCKKSHPNWPAIELRLPLAKAGDCVSHGVGRRESEICYDVACSVIMEGMYLIFL
jgi:hypothetical protein